MNSKKVFPKPFLSLVFLFAFSGCSILYHTTIDGIDVKKIDSNDAYPPGNPDKVVFFQSQDAIPRGLHSIKVAELSSNLRANYGSFKDFLKDFKQKAAQLGGNSIVLETTTRENYGIDSIYKGKGIVYRLYLNKPIEEIDLTVFSEATQWPPQPK